MKRPYLSGLAAALVAALVSTVAAPRPAQADHLSSGRIHDYEDRHHRDYYWYQLQIERERIAAEEEARREVVREKRRDALEEKLEREEMDFLERQSAIRDANRAATLAPRGFYYRRPGSTLVEPPEGYVEVSVDDAQYAYFSGIFLRRVGARWVVVTAPRGAVVASPPEGSTEIVRASKAYSYYYGTFFLKEGEEYRVVDPPAGLLVGYLPDGYQQKEIDGLLHFTFGGVTYRPFSLEGVPVYRVVAD